MLKLVKKDKKNKSEILTFSQKTPWFLFFLNMAFYPMRCLRLCLDEASVACQLWWLWR